MVKLLYFFKLTSGLFTGKADLPQNVAHVAGLLAFLAKQNEKYRIALADGSGIKITINKQFVESAAAVNVGDEIAFFSKAL